jgi:hypothetical protein
MCGCVYVWVCLCVCVGVYEYMCVYFCVYVCEFVCVCECVVYGSYLAESEDDRPTDRDSPVLNFTSSLYSINCTSNG